MCIAAAIYACIKAYIGGSIIVPVYLMYSETHVEALVSGYSWTHDGNTGEESMTVM